MVGISTLTPLCYELFYTMEASVVSMENVEVQLLYVRCIVYGGMLVESDCDKTVKDRAES